MQQERTKPGALLERDKHDLKVLWVVVAPPYEERGSDWSHQVSAVATTRWLQRDQILSLRRVRLARLGVIAHKCRSLELAVFLHTGMQRKSELHSSLHFEATTNQSTFRSCLLIPAFTIIMRLYETDALSSPAISKNVAVCKSDFLLSSFRDALMLRHFLHWNGRN